MKLREIPCPVFGDGHPAYVPGDCWFARPSTEAEREAARSRKAPLMTVAQYRWAWWTDRARLFDDSEIAHMHRDRRPLVVVLPSGGIFVTTQPVRASSTLRAWHAAQDAWVQAGRGTWEEAYARVACPSFEAGWAISGEGIALTLSPSINYDPGGTHNWHGYLVNGELRPA